MNMASQSLLPQTTAGAGAGGVSTPAARAFFGRVSDGVRRVFSQRKPWMEMVDRSSFSKPESVSDAMARIRNNLSYFRVNYLILLVFVVSAGMLAHPLSLFILQGLMAAWIFLYLVRSEPLVVLGRSFSDREVLGMMVLLTVVVVFLTDVGALLISSLLVGAAIVAAHGAFRAPDELLFDEPQPAAQGGSFLAFLGTATSPQPPLVSHV